MISVSKWIAGVVVVAWVAFNPSYMSLAHAEDIGAETKRQDDAFLLMRDAVRQLSLIHI